MSKSPPRLGRGLSSLVSTSALGDVEVGVLAGGEIRQQSTDQGSATTTRAVPRVLQVQLSQIRTNPMQPRRSFDEEALAALADSMRLRGALQPILVRPAESGFELVAGERRLRAAQIAGITELPAIVRTVRDDEMLELALVENIQRSDLNPVERARGYKTLASKYGLSQEAIARKVGEDRATVANYVRLLGLPDEVLEMIAKGELSTGHAKAILGSQDRNIQLRIASNAVAGNWSVRQTEAAIAKGRAQGGIAKAEPETRPAVRDIEQRLAAALGTRVRIQEGRRRHTGRVIIEYYNLDDFERITARLGLTGANR